MSRTHKRDLSNSTRELLTYTSPVKFAGRCVFIIFIFALPFVVYRRDDAMSVFFCVIMILVGSVGLYVFAPHRLVSTRPQVIINNNGITSSRWGYTTIPWGDIVGARIHRGARGTRFLIVQLKNPDKYHPGILSQLAWWRGNGAWLNLTGLDRSQQTVADFVATFREILPADKSLQRTAVATQHLLESTAPWRSLYRAAF